MATTTATFLRDYSTALTAKLVSVGGTGTPNAAGYACTNSNGLQSLSITEALVGEFYAYAYDSLGDIAYQGYVLLADDTGTYRVDDTLAAFKADATLGTATGGLVANVALLVREETQISGTDADVITIVRNDTVSFTFDVTTDFTGYTGLLTIRHRVTDDELMQVSVTVTSSVLLTVPLSSTDTAFTDLVSLTEFGPHPFDIQMTSGSTVKTPVTGVAVIRRDQTT